MHFVKDCPHNDSPAESATPDTRITLYQCKVAVDEMQVLMGEVFSCGLLDSGCPGTVCGKSWLRYYADSLTKEDRALIKEYETTNRFRFGKGEIEDSMMLVRIPAHIGGKDIFIMTDVVQSDIPLLLSRSTMKKAEAVLDFDKDVITFLGVKEPLIVTKSGHYALPLCRSRRMVEREQKGAPQNEDRLVLLSVFASDSSEMNSQMDDKAIV